jgi:transposase
MRSQAYFVGIDLHKELIQVCALDADGEKITEHRFPGGSLEQGQAVVMKVLSQWKDGGRFAVEALGMNRWLVNAMREQKMDVVVVDPVKLNLRMLGKKTDRRDAYELARRLWLGDIDRNAKTYYPDEERYGCRKVLRTRHKLVQVRQQLVNQARGLLNAYRIEAPKGELTSKKNLEWLERVELFGTLLTECLRSLGQALRSVQSSIDALTKRIEQEASKEEVFGLQENLEGVGPQTALTLVHELGDVKRFTSTRAVASYAGLAPRVANSADKAHHGKITKRGNSELRWILSEWAVRLMTRNELVRRWAAPLLRRMHKNKVRIALARRLLIGVYFMLRHGVAFSLERCLATKAA